MKVYFIADYFREHINGGAESNDKVLIDKLSERGYDIEKISSTQAHLYTSRDGLFIISNFINMSEGAKAELRGKKYIIYEHDHKYHKYRNPSKYRDFIVPEDQIVNKEFYQNAHAVVVLSQVCKETIEKNLKISNVYNIGTSLWSDEKLSYIEGLHNLKLARHKKFVIVNSPNPIKGAREAVVFCESRDLEYKLIPPCPERDLLAHMRAHEGFVFIPKVLETFSRIVMEAKMIGCKVATNKKLLGCASETTLFSLNGKPLIEEIRGRVEAAVDLFDGLLKMSKSRDDITVILNCYRRPHLLEEQVKAIRKQSVQPKEIWLWVNFHVDNVDYNFDKLDVDRVITNDHNWKYFGRFSIAMLAQTEYVAFFDDDTIPGENWFENCLVTMRSNPGILGGAGVRLKGAQYRNHDRFGWSSQNETIEEVDLVGHAWFLKQSWMKYLWYEKPLMLDNGEDIHLSYCCKKYGDIKTFCPPHPKDDLTKHSSLKGYEYGIDNVASSNTRNHELFYAQRDAIVANAISNGWKIVNK